MTSIPDDALLARRPGDNVIVPDDQRTYFLNHVSWAAVIAGLAAALVVQLLLNMLGLGIGAASLNVYNSNANPDAQTLSTTAAIWWIVSGLLASLVGGLVAGRLCGTAHRSTAQWHGFLSWAAATLILFFMLTTAIGGIAGGTLNTLGRATGAVGQAAVTVAANQPPSSDSSGLNGEVRRLVNPNDPQTVQENILAYIQAGIAGDPQRAQVAKDRAVNSLSAQANISPDEARSRIDQLESTARQTAEEAKQKAQQGADVARKGVARAGLFGFIALLLGAIAAWLGGGWGAPRRAVAIVPPTRL